MSATPIKLTFMQVVNLSDALPQLDGYMSDGKATPFKLDHNTRWNYGKNLGIFNDDTKKIQEGRDTEIRRVSPTNLNVSKEPKEVQEAYAKWSKDYYNTIIEVPGVLKLKRSKLYAHDNPIPGTVIAALMPIIEDDGEMPDSSK